MNNSIVTKYQWFAKIYNEDIEPEPGMFMYWAKGKGIWYWG